MTKKDRSRTGRVHAGSTSDSTDRLRGPSGKPLRLRAANRDQVVPVPAYLDALIDERHLARLIWRVVERLDLSAFAEGLVVEEGGPGRSAADPKILVGL